jgi:hypothetical protein
VSDPFGPSRSAFTGRAEHPLVAGHTSWVLFISAKNLLVEAQAPKPFDLDQTFEPGVRNRRPTIDVGGSEDARSIMSDEFDSLDATEKAAVEGALNNAKRPSNDVVQTAPVKCRYTKSGICANIAGFCLCRQDALQLMPHGSGSDEQMFGAKQQVPHGLRSDQEA